MPLVFDPRFVDVDFDAQSRASRRDRGWTGIEPVAFRDAGVPHYRDVEPLIPDAEWPRLIREYERQWGLIAPHITRIYDQDGEPSCVSNAFCQAHEIVQARTFGHDRVVHLSAISLYKRVGSPRSGSTLWDNMREMTTRGALPLDNPQNRQRFAHVFPANGYHTPWPTGWEETARLFQNAEWADIDSLQEFMTALLRGHPVIYARSGHCILAVTPVLRNSTLYCGYVNSWGRWGAPVNERFDYGMGFDTRRVMSYGGYALRSIRLPDQLLG